MLWRRKKSLNLPFTAGPNSGYLISPVINSLEELDRVIWETLIQPVPNWNIIGKTVSPILKTSFSRVQFKIVSKLHYGWLLEWFRSVSRPCKGVCLVAIDATLQRWTHLKFILHWSCHQTAKSPDIIVARLGTIAGKQETLTFSVMLNTHQYPLF